jgi:uncharacterized membrane protein
MIHFIKVWLSAVPLIALVDFIWFSLIAGKFYDTYMGTFVTRTNGSIDIKLFPALVVYLALAFGITFFVLPKVAGLEGLWHVFFIGAIFGLVTYVVYDMTNYAFLTNWSLTLSLVDMAWGFVIGGLSTVIVRYLDRFFI